LDKVQGDSFPDYRDSFVRVADHRGMELASGNHVSDRDLVLLPILLFRILRDRTLRRFELSIFWAMVVLWILDFKEAALGSD
jgi:hypothetical protein